MHLYGGIPGGDLGTGLTIIGTGGDLTTIRGDLIMTPGTVLGDLMIPGIVPGLIPALIILTIPVTAPEALMFPDQP